MKKLIAVATMIAATGAMAQSTSTTDVNTSSKSVLEKVGMWYYGEADTDAIVDAKHTKGERNTEFLNYLNVNYEISSIDSIDTTFRMYFDDSLKGPGQGDQYVELDQRVRHTRVLYKDANSRLRIRTTFELPTTDASRESDKITRFKPWLELNETIDDLNSLILGAGFNKDYRTKAQDSVDETSRHYITTFISYANSALSEDYKLRLDIEGTLRHIPGGAETDLRATNEDRVLAGINTEILGMNVYGYAQHDPSRVKAADQLGAGVQLFKAF